jgi:hypothetical protein
VDSSVIHQRPNDVDAEERNYQNDGGSPPFGQHHKPEQYHWYQCEDRQDELSPRQPLPIAGLTPGRVTSDEVGGPTEDQGDQSKDGKGACRHEPASAEPRVLAPNNPAPFHEGALAGQALGTANAIADRRVLAVQLGAALVVAVLLRRCDLVGEPALLEQ